MTCYQKTTSKSTQFYTVYCSVIGFSDILRACGQSRRKATMSNDLYQQLLAEAQKREAELETARAAFERSQEAARMAAEALRNAANYLKPANSATTARQALSPATLAALREPTHPEVTHQPSFIEVVDEAIKGIDSNITTALVFALLTDLQVPLGDTPRTKISTALSRLEQRGSLVKSVAGSMGRAHTYERPKVRWPQPNGGEKG